jgi:Phosphotransferase enzyme family
VSDPTDINGNARRIDWRFLTGTPSPRRVLCLAGGDLRDAVGAIAGEVVGEAAPGTCDLAVLRNPGKDVLARAFAALEPGGALYVEAWRPLADRASALTRRVAGAGFADTASYWPWPPPNHGPPNFWLPVDSETAVSWWVHRSPPGKRWTDRLAVRVARTVWWLLWRAGVLLPLCVTARKPGGANAQAATTVARRDLAAESPESVACILLTGGRSVSSKVVALAFADDEPRPRLALKLPRIPAASASLHHEASVLRQLQASGVGPGLPSVLAEHELAGGFAVAETVVVGRPLAELLDAATYPALAAQVGSLLGDLATSPPGLTAEWWTWIAEPNLDVLEEWERPRAREILRGIGDVPEVPEHRDCSPWNVIIQPDGTLALLDWESSESAGVPGPDLIYFLTFASFFVDETMDTGRELASYNAMLDPRTMTGGVYRSCTAAYSSRVGLDPEQLDGLRLLCWLIHAHSAEVRRDETAGTPLLSLFLELARSELARQG